MESVKKFIDERAQHKRQYDRRVNKRLMQTQESKVVSSKVVDVDLVFMKSNGTESEKQDTSSSSGNYLTHVVDVDIRLHTEQSEPIYDTYLLEKIDSNTSPDSTNMSHRGGEIEQDAEQYQVKSHLLNAELFKTKDMINELKAQLQAKNLTINNLKKQIKNVHEKSNEAKVKQTINIELEHKVAKLLKENETLKKHYKELYDSIKVTRTKTIEQTTSLIAINDEFKAQLQEKVFTITA
ncbi:hypothetical protein Tco_0906562 [Tanacetum coccineum]|uniref:Uncharacterized protein n=1 Tax=Tanacetum coccineum TaxID=301880 RepID=A0ABQ5CIB3_9ASTR